MYGSRSPSLRVGFVHSRNMWLTRRRVCVSLDGSVRVAPPIQCACRAVALPRKQAYAKGYQSVVNPCLNDGIECAGRLPGLLFWPGRAQGRWL